MPLSGLYISIFKSNISITREACVLQLEKPVHCKDDPAQPPSPPRQRAISLST